MNGAAQPFDQLPSLTIDQVLTELGELSPGNYLAGLVGGGVLGLDDIKDLVDKVLTATDRLLSLPLDMAGWLIDRFTDVNNWVYGAVDKIYGWVWDAAHWTGGEVWSAAAGMEHFVQDVGSFVAGEAWSAAAGVEHFVQDVGSFVAGEAWSAAAGVEHFVQDAASFVAGEAWSAAAGVEHFVQDAASFVAGEVWSASAALDHFLSDTASWLDGQIADARTTVINHVTDVGQYVGQQVISGVVGGADSLGGFFLDGLKYLVTEAFSPISNELDVAASIPVKLLNGDYESLDNVLEDLVQPQEKGGIWQLLFTVASVLPAISTLLVDTGHVYAEPAAQKIAQRIGPTLPSVGDARDAFLRGLIGESEHDEILGRLGFSPERIAWMNALEYDIPGVGDLLNMARRRAFDPGLVAAFGHDQEMPGDFVGFAAQNGMPENFARLYWAASWSVPSLGEARDLLHRGLIDADYFGTLMRAQHVSPGWRAPLQAAIYDLVPVRYLRQMFAQGIIDDAGLLDGYTKLGYSPEDAGRFTELARRLAAHPPARLPRDVILRAYRDGELSRADAEAEMTALGYTADDTGFQLDLEDLENAREVRNLEESIIEADFHAGIIDEATATADLLQLSVPQDRAGLLVLKWRNRKAAKSAQLAVGQVQRLYRDGQLSEQAARGRFAALGYNDTDAADLIALAAKEATIPAAPELSVSQLFAALRAGIMDEPGLRDRLAHRGFSSADVDVLVALADPEPAPKAPPSLTLAELIKAVKAKVITVEDLQQRLVSRGYTPGDVDVLLKSEKIDAEPTVAAPQLALSQLVQALRDGIIDEPTVRERLTARGFAATDIDIMLQLALPQSRARELSVAEDQLAFKKGLITEEELRSRLSGMGFNDTDVDLLVQLVTPAAAGA